LVTVPVAAGVQPVALPLAAIPSGKLPAEQGVGVEAKAVAVAALPLVLAALFGMSAEASARNAGAPLPPVAGPAYTLFCP
jgi:hypothetical protein